MAYSDILKAYSDYIVCNIFKVIVEGDDGETLVYDKLQSASLESSMENTEVKGYFA